MQILIVLELVDVLKYMHMEIVEIKINSIDIKRTITFFLFKNIPTIPIVKIIAPKNK